MKKLFPFIFSFLSATSYNTIAIDGSSSGWASDETFSDISAAEMHNLLGMQQIFILPLAMLKQTMITLHIFYFSIQILQEIMELLMLTLGVIMLQPRLKQIMYTHLNGMAINQMHILS